MTVPLTASKAGLRRRIAELEAETRHQRYTIRVLTTIAGLREDERAKHRSEVGKHEKTIDEQRRALTRIVELFQEDRSGLQLPGTGRSWTCRVPAHRLRAWQELVVEPEPEGAAA